jgi:hypothetical protein
MHPRPGNRTPLSLNKKKQEPTTQEDVDAFSSGGCAESQQEGNGDDTWACIDGIPSCLGVYHCIRATMLVEQESCGEQNVDSWGRNFARCGCCETNCRSMQVVAPQPDLRSNEGKKSKVLTSSVDVCPSHLEKIYAQRVCSLCCCPTHCPYDDNGSFATKPPTQPSVGKSKATKCHAFDL